MDIRKWGVAVSGAVLVGSLGLVQGVTMGAASAAPASTAVVADRHPGNDNDNDHDNDHGRDYRQGYRDGYGDGWTTAKDECRRPNNYSHLSNHDRDYARGYDDGFGKGFAAGFDEYCHSATAAGHGHGGHH